MQYFYFLLVIHFYSGQSAVDKCTLYCDQNLINRRNVKSDVDGAVNACRKFFNLEVRARLIVATPGVMNLECFKDSPDNSTELNNLKEASGAEKKRYLRELATSVVDKYVAQKRKVKDFLTKVLSVEELEKIQSIAVFQDVLNHLHSTAKEKESMNHNMILLSFMMKFVSPAVLQFNNSVL